METRLTPLTVRAGELIARPLEACDWKVEGLFRTNRKRASVLAGKPGSGKSTLAWQLAIALVKGEPFLGRACKRCEVLYWQSEETENEINQILRELGYDRERDEVLHIAHGVDWGDKVEKQCTALAAFLAANPNVQFVILETLDDFLKLSDVKENTAARISFETFEKQVMGNFASQASFLFLHQMKKEVTEDSGDGLLGASGIRAKLDVQIYIKDGGDNDPRRTVQTRRRRSGVTIHPDIPGVRRGNASQHARPACSRGAHAKRDEHSRPNPV
jgi:AAA domain-containing protein